MNLFALYILQAINSIAPLVVIPYLTRVLSPAGYGAIAFYQSIVAYGVIILDFGFYVSAIRDVARFRDDPAGLSRKFKSVIATKCVLLVAVLACMLVATIAVPEVRQNWALFFACGFQLLGNIALPNWLFQGMETSQRIIVPQITSKLITTALIFALVHSNQDIVWAALFLSCSDVICGGFALRSVLKIVPLGQAKISWDDVKRAFREDFPLFAISVGGNLYAAFNPLFIEIFWGHAEVAYYAIALRIATAISKVTGPLVQAVSPRLAILVVDDVRRALKVLIRSGAGLVLSTVLFGLYTLFCSSSLLELVAGGRYVGATEVLRVLSPVGLLMVLGALVGQNFGVHLGLSTIISKVYWAVGIVNLLLAVPVTRAFGAVGAASLLMLAECAVVASLFALVFRRLGGGREGGVWVSTESLQSSRLRVGDHSNFDGSL